MAGGHRFTSKKGMTLSTAGWLCQKWDPGHPEHPPPLSTAEVTAIKHGKKQWKQGSSAY